MRLATLVLGGVVLGATLAAQLAGAGSLEGVVTWFQGLGVGLLLGVGGAMLAPSRGEEAAEAREPRSPSLAAPALRGGPVPAGAPAAPGSGRARAPGHALDASLDPTLESTIAAEHEPMRGVIPLPGLAQAALETRRSGARAYLHVFSGKNKGESLLLGDEPVTLGRDPKNALVLKDEGVSQVHAELRLDGARFVLRDLGSRNGTFVNDERVISRQLEGGDVVGLGGETKLLFQAGG